MEVETTSSFHVCPRAVKKSMADKQGNISGKLCVEVANKASLYNVIKRSWLSRNTYNCLNTKYSAKLTSTTGLQRHIILLQTATVLKNGFDNWRKNDTRARDDHVYVQPTNGTSSLEGIFR